MRTEPPSNHQPSKGRQRLLLVLKIALTAAALAIVASFVNFKSALAGLRSANLWWFTGSFALLLVSTWQQALRWKSILGRQEIPTRKFAYYLFMGYALNLLVPSQVGSDLIRSTAFGRRYGNVGLNIGISVALRVVGLAILLVFAAAGAWFYRDALIRGIHWQVSWKAVSLLAIACILGLVAVGYIWRNRERNITIRALLDSLSDRTVLRKVLVHSLLIQLQTSVSTWMLFHSVFPHPDFWQITLFNSIVLVALLLPLSIGGVGIREVLNLALFTGIGGLSKEGIITVSVLGYTSLLMLAATGAIWIGIRWLSAGSLAKAANAD